MEFLDPRFDRPPGDGLGRSGRSRLPASSLGDWFGALRGRRSLVAVVGRSMEPTLSPGDRVWVDRRAYRDRAPEPGDIVLIRRPNQPELQLIKRVVGDRLGEGYLVLGDNAAASTDSRHFGPVPAADVLGRVVSRIAHPGSLGE